MNVLFLINEFGKGGAERVVSYLLRYLPQYNSINSYFLYFLEDEEEEYLIPKHARVISNHKRSSSHLLNFLKLPIQAIRLKKSVKKFNINIVISFLNRSNYVNIMSKYFGSIHKCIISERNTAGQVYSSSNLIDSVNRLLIEKLYPKSDHIIAISKGVKSDLHDNFKINGNKITVIHNPIDINFIRKKSMEKINHLWINDPSIQLIISIGRLEKQKNQSLLIQAFYFVNKQFPNARLLILGEGSLREELQQLISSLNLNSRIELFGQVENPFAYLAQADIFVLSSDFEGFGNVITEAMACGCPVISTDCQSGPNEIISHNKDGILVAVGDIEAMGEAIIKLLENKSLRNELAANAQIRVSDFNLDTIVQQYYQNLNRERL